MQHAFNFKHFKKNQNQINKLQVENRKKLRRTNSVSTTHYK